MNDAAIYRYLTKLFRELFDDRNINLLPGTRDRDIAGWNSLKTVSIISSVEEKFGFQMSSSEMDRLRSVADLVAVIKAHCASRRMNT